MQLAENLATTIIAELVLKLIREIMHFGRGRIADIELKKPKGISGHIAKGTE